MAGLLGDEYAAFLASYAAAPGVGLQVNTRKLTPYRLQALAPFDLAPVAWSPDAYLVPETAQPGKHPYHAAGLYYLQDPSAMIPALLLDPQPRLQPGPRSLQHARARQTSLTRTRPLRLQAGTKKTTAATPKILAQKTGISGVRP